VAAAVRVAAEIAAVSAGRYRFSLGNFSDRRFSNRRRFYFKVVAQGEFERRIAFTPARPPFSDLLEAHRPSHPLGAAVVGSYISCTLRRKAIFSAALAAKAIIVNVGFFSDDDGNTLPSTT
jgi:hypothetical protein